MISNQLSSPVTPGTGAGDASNYVDDVLVDRIWCDLGKRIPHEYIRQVALEIAAEFREAKVTAFVPIFIRRQTLQRLSNH